jgi:ABC-type branched-subunit amino acid transport system ATPase component
VLAELVEVDAGYGEIQVLQKVSLHVNPGEIVSVIGPNGAGKSTAIKCFLGLVRVTGGQVLLEGREITGRPTHEMVKLGIGYVPQGRIVFPEMTVLENLEMGGFTVKDKALVRRRLEELFAIFPRLAERKGQRAGTMSGGEQQMLAIARALVTRPRLLVMDEPSLGLSPKYVKLVFEKIVELKERMGMAILMVEQNASQALAISDRGYVLELGANRFEGSGRALLADPRVRALYLGGAAG